MTPQLLAKVRLALDALPDYREDRIEEARAHLENGPPAPGEIAEMMIGRLISDAIR